MNKYILSYSEYMNAGPYMASMEAKDLRGLLLDLLGYDDDGESLKFLKKEFDSQNGDGMPWIMAFDVNANEKVLG